jgi:hypothetical protein
LDWLEFKSALNQFGTLKWNIDNLAHSTTFLDLELTIEGNKIKAKTFQKPMNLYLYIPPLSAHPLGCFKSLITGELLRYWKQNSDPKDFIEITSLFIQPLLDRGHLLNTITPLLQTAASTIDNQGTARRINQRETDSDETLFIHWEHHPSSLTNQEIWNIYNDTIHKVDSFDYMRIALSLPRNLRDLLCHTKLPIIEDRNASDFLKKLLQNKKDQSFDNTKTT